MRGFKPLLDRGTYQMKKIIIALAVITLIGLLYGCESTYTRQATVIKSANGIVYCVDKQGNIWSYKGDSAIGQKVILKMYDNHTDSIKDDIVKGVKTK